MNRTLTKCLTLFFLAWIGNGFLLQGQHIDSHWVDSVCSQSFQLRKSNPRESIRLAGTALEAARDLNYHEGIARSWSRFGIAHSHMKRYDSALFYFHQSLHFREDNHMPLKGQGQMHVRLGNNYLNKGMYARGFSHLKRAREIFQALGPEETKRLLSAQNDLSIAYKRQAERKLRIYDTQAAFPELDTAISLIQHNLAFYDENQQPYAYAQTCNSLSALYRDRQNPDSAWAYLRKAEHIFDSLHRAHAAEKPLAYLAALADVALKKAYLYSLDNNFEAALASNQLAWELSKQVGENELKLMAINNLGHDQLKSGNYAEALPYFEQVQGLLDSVPLDPEDKIILYRNLSYTYDSLENYLQAYSYLHRAYEAKDSISQEELRGQIADAEENLQVQQALILETKEKEFQRSIWITLIGIFAIVVVVGYLRFRERERERQAYLLSVLEQTEQKILRAQHETQEELLEKLGRELHDSLGGMLNSAKREMEGLLQRMDEDARDRFSRTQQLLGQSLTEMRRISHELTNPKLEQDLESALKGLCKTLNEAQSGPNIKLYAVRLDKLPPRIELNAYRIIQEALTNVIKHAQASEVTLQLIQEDRILSITVEDNGKGFDREKIKSGIGLANIRSRAESLKGNLNIDTALDKGTTLFIEIPLPIPS